MKRERVIKMLNLRLTKNGSRLRFRKSDVEYCLEVFLMNDKYAEPATINLNNKFYKLIDDRFSKVYGISAKQLKWNNSGTVLSIWVNENKSWMDG